MYDIGLHNKYNEKIEVDLNIARNKINRLNHQEWCHEVENKPKLRSYKTFKFNVEPEAYITNNMFKNQRSLMAQLRLGILPLRIETGRYSSNKKFGNNKKLSINERICQMCDNKEIENEIHFTCKCPCYDNIRKYMFDNYKKSHSGFMNKSDNEKFIYLMSHPNKSLANFIVKSWGIRKNILYKINFDNINNKN